jgi:hypothetical protein
MMTTANAMTAIRQMLDFAEREALRTGRDPLEILDGIADDIHDCDPDDSPYELDEAQFELLMTLITTLAPPA